MKYLKIHKLIWFVLVLTITIIESILILLPCIILFLWDFKFRFDKYWRRFHRKVKSSRWSSDSEYIIYSYYPTKSFTETFISRLNYWKNHEKV